MKVSCSMCLLAAEVPPHDRPLQISPGHFGRYWTSFVDIERALPSFNVLDVLCRALPSFNELYRAGPILNELYRAERVWPSFNEF